MSVAVKREVSLEALESQYNEITALYDLASELVETTESRFIQDPERQWGIVEPLISELGEATDILTEEFIHMSEGLRKHTTGKASKARIEAALRRVYGAVNDYRERVRNVTRQAYKAIENIADPIVQKIQRQVEKVVGIFLEFMQLSLTSIMSQAELSQLRARDARVALMMHQAAQQAPQ